MSASFAASSFGAALRLKAARVQNFVLDRSEDELDFRSGLCAADPAVRR
jgi:hypothetical protein